MGFLAPFAPLIGAGVGGLFGSRKSNLEKQISNKINPTLSNLTNWAGQANSEQQRLQGVQSQYNDMARSYEPIAAGDLGRASSFYGRMLAPRSTEALQEILGPQFQSLMRNYGSAIQTAGRTGSRGGGRTSAESDFAFQRNRDFLNLVPQARMQAAQGLLQTSGTAGQQAGRLNQTGLGYGQLGLGYGHLAGGLSGSVLDFANPALKQMGQQRMQSGLEWGGLGQQIGKLFSPILAGIGQGKQNAIKLGGFDQD